MFLSWNAAPVGSALVAICLLVTAAARRQKPGISASLADHDFRRFLNSLVSRSKDTSLVDFTGLFWVEMSNALWRLFAEIKSYTNPYGRVPWRDQGSAVFTQQWHLLSKDILTYFWGLISFKRKKKTTIKAMGLTWSNYIVFFFFFHLYINVILKERIMDYPERVFVMWILLFSTMLLLFYKDVTFVFQVHRILHSFIKKQALQQQCFIFSLSCSCPWRNSIDKKAFIFGTHIAGVWTAHSIVLKQRHYKDECRNSKKLGFFSFLIEVLGCLHTSKYLIFFHFQKYLSFQTSPTGLHLTLSQLE